MLRVYLSVVIGQQYLSKLFPNLAVMKNLHQYPQ
jgi:hypothetical protein